MKKGKMPIKQLVLIVAVLLLINLTSVNAVTIHQIFLPLVINGAQTTPTGPEILPLGASVDFSIFRGRITGSERVDHLVGDYETVYPNQIFVIAFVNVENLGYSSDYVGSYDLKLRDSVGRLFDIADLDVQWAAEEQYDKTGIYADIQPGFTEEQVFAFDVAIDATGLELVASNYAQPITPVPNPTPTSIVNIGSPGNFDHWQYTVTNVIRTTTLNGDYETITAKGEFLVIFATVQNFGSESDYIGSFDFIIQDSLTRQFDIAGLEAQWAAQDQYNLTGIYKDIQPSFIENQVYVFDILPTASGLYFVPTSSGNAVNLNQ